MPPSGVRDSTESVRAPPLPSAAGVASLNAAYSGGAAIGLLLPELFGGAVGAAVGSSRSSIGRSVHRGAFLAA